MAHLKAEVEKLMRARRAVIEALIIEDQTHGGWVGTSLTDAQEQVVATYVLALETSSVADATYRMGPT